MNRLVILAASLGLTVGCGITQKSFSEDFVEQYCDAHADCDRRGRPCPVTLDDEGQVYADCAFDAELAEACLAETYTCDDTIPENAVVVVPEACHVVCGDLDVNE